MFTAEYKLHVLRELERATEHGAVGALLRREGLYRSQVARWKAAQKRGELSGLAGKKRGRPGRPRDGRIAELERENRRLMRKLERAEALIELQKKVSEILGIELPESEEQSERR